MEERKMEIIEKIQKCLLLAQDQEGTPEGDSARRSAALLMAKYRIEETEIDLETDKFILDTFEFMNDGSEVPQWVSSIIATFCYCFDCQSVFRTTYTGKEWEIIGTFSDVETVLYFVEVVCNHIEKEGWKLWNKDKNYKKRNQLGNVAANVIWDRAWELKAAMDQTIHEDEHCTALVVKKEKEVAEAVAELYPNLTSSRARKKDMPNDVKTRAAGQRAGETAPMNFAIDA